MLTVTGDGEQRRDFTYVGDIVDGLWRCGKSLYDTGDRVVISGKIFELGNGKNYSILDLVDVWRNGSEYIGIDLEDELEKQSQTMRKICWDGNQKVI